jgi:hypothetical protein
MSTSPKIYLLKNAEGKFVSVEQTNVHFVTKMCYARYTKNQKEIEAKKMQLEKQSDLTSVIIDKWHTKKKDDINTNPESYYTED